FSAALTTQVATLVAPVINPNFPVVTSPPIPGAANPPTLINIAWTVPTEPNPIGTLPPGLTGYLPGQFTGVAPILNFPLPPAAFSTPEPTPPALNLNFTYPTLSITLPTPPTLFTLDTVVFNPLNIPTFNVTVPTLTIATPTIDFFTEPALYTSTLLTQAQTDLLNALQEGTWTGLPAPV